MRAVTVGYFVCVILAVCATVAASEPVAIEIPNADFSAPARADGQIEDWGFYGAPDKTRRISIVEAGEEHGQAVLIEDESPTAEIGIYKDIPVPGADTYRVTVSVRGVSDSGSAGAYLQMRLQPSNEFAQTSLAAQDEGRFNEISLTMTAPEGTKTLRIYLYTHAGPTPKVMVDNVKLEKGVPLPPPPPKAPDIPDPTPPVYQTLKDLHRNTPLVTAGQPSSAIVAPISGRYDSVARAIQTCVRDLTGTELPILRDDSAETQIPITRHCIVLGNRSTNRLMSDLYDRFFTLLDPKYPGSGGHVLRTVHNPFGNGCNAILVGGSDDEGVQASAGVLAEKLRASAAGADLSVGWIADIVLGQGQETTHDVTKAQIWDASVGYGSSGYFGWNSISKRMAQYYMTGDEFFAREVVRLSFPDKQALAEIDKIDQEMIEGKNDPLAGPYHYSAHYAILFWDLIEESPVFTDEERLKITNAFCRQLNHRVPEGVYLRTGPAAFTGNRHTDWAAVSLYCLGRYFQKDYPDPIWQRCLDSVHLYYDALEQHAWLAGNNDHLFWYNTYFEPIASYMLLSGDRRGLDNGNLQKALATQDILYTGRIPDPYLNTAPISMLNKLAYLTGDPHWLFYVPRTQMDTGVFRLGQSFWPGSEQKAAPPEHLVGKWTLQEMPLPMWQGRGSGIPLESQFLWASYRSAWDGSGDYILLDGFNGGGRNPYHTLGLLEFRLNGSVLLQNYHNQVLTSADGMVEPLVAMDAALLYADTLGDTAIAAGEVPRTPFCNWKRTFALREGRYGLIVDDLTFRTDSENMKVVTTWEPVGGVWMPDQQALRIGGKTKTGPPPGWLGFRALDSEYTSDPPGAEGTSRLDSIDIVLLKATRPGHWVEMRFSLDEPVAGDVFVDLLNYVDRGKVKLYLDGEVAVEQFEHYAPAAVRARVPLGKRELAAGEHTLRLEMLSESPTPGKFLAGLIGVSIRPEGASKVGNPAMFELRASDVMETSPGGIVNMTWRGEVAKGDRRTAFYLLGQQRPGSEDRVACLQLAPNAAALEFPQKAIAVAGEYGDTDGELVVLAEDHLYGKSVKAAGLGNALVSANAPVDVDWDFPTGVLCVSTQDPVQLSVRLAADDQAMLGGEVLVTVADEAGMVSLELPAGRHEISGVRPAPEALAAITQELTTLLSRAGAARKEKLSGQAQVARIDVPSVPGKGIAEAGADIVALTTMRVDGQTRLCAAEGNTVHVLGLDGQEVMKLETDGQIRVLAWWDEHKLLLAGCKDEKVIAFDAEGNRKWEFVSDMDPAVYEAAKQYWFKSAHPGIYGLHTGVFLNGKSQAFVGSACTLEILDETGKLVKRMPVFWGPGAQFNLIDGPDGSVNLLVHRWPNGTDALAIINNRTLSNGRGFEAVPAGYTHVGGWTALNRARTLYTDLDGDGAREVVSAINGVWNRITAWDANGTPLYNAQFGPGEKAPAGQMADMDIADIDGDGKQEVLAATLEGVVVALDCRLAKLWAKATPTAPRVLRCVDVPGTGKRIVVGCDDGTVVVFDPSGVVVAQAKVTGRPRQILTVDDGGDALVVIATSSGQVQVLAPNE